jgi:hypothetical protein
MVRGSTLRVTQLREDGAISDPVAYAVSRSVVKVDIDEVTDDQGNETYRDETDQPRIHLPGTDEVVGYVTRSQFLRVDPGFLSLMAGVEVALDANGDGVGFDARTKIPAKAFALEVWSKLTGPVCADGPKWGYTLFPCLKGGTLAGFEFANALTTFTLDGAMTESGRKWHVGPYDLHERWERLLDPVSRNTPWHTEVTDVPPPTQTDGIVTFVDRVANGTPANPMPIPTDPVRLIGGTAAYTSPWIVSGGGP